MSTYIYMLPERLATLRSEKGWTLQETAKKLETTRVSYSYYENGSRHPNAEMIGIMCKAFDVSADYLLGLSSTKRPEYANVADTTGLTEESILSLDNPAFKTKHILNRLICEEPALAQCEIAALYEPMELGQDYIDYLNSPEYIEEKYQEHLRFLAGEEEQASKSILDHLSDDWHFSGTVSDEEIDYFNSPEHIAKMEQEAQWERDQMEERYANAGHGTIEDAINQEHRLKAFWAHKEAESKKSNLLSAIAAYVAYQSGCVLETAYHSEKLSDAHQIHIGTGHGEKIAFPSKEGDELLEFALVQRVISALKVFKTNFYSEQK